MITKPYLLRFISWFALMGIALLVRLYGMSEFAYNDDELRFIMIAAGESFEDIWRRSLMETHPPLAHLLRHYLLSFSHDPFFQRTANALLSLLMIPGFFKLGVILKGQKLGWFFVVYAAFMPIAVTLSIVLRNNVFFMCVSGHLLYL